MLFIDIEAIINSLTYHEELYDNDGYPIGAIRRFLFNLLTMWKDRSKVGPTLIVFGEKIPDWRKEAVPTYRQLRSITHKKYRARVNAQVKLLWDLLPELGLTCMKIREFEALDGIFKYQIDHKKFDNLFVYGTDRNTSSLIQQNVILHAVFKNSSIKQFCEPLVIERPHRFVGDQSALYISLVGNKRLGIPRHKGVGRCIGRKIVIATDARKPGELSEDLLLNSIKKHAYVIDWSQIENSWRVLSLAYNYSKKGGKKAEFRFRNGKFPTKKEFKEILYDEFNIDDFIMYYEQFIDLAKEHRWR